MVQALVTKGRRLAWLVLVLALASTPSSAAIRQESGTGQAAQAQEGIPVRLDGEVVFHVREGIGPFSVAERASSAEERLELIAGDPFYSEALIRIVKSEDGAEVYYRDDLVGYISQKDATREGASAEELAASTIQTIKRAIREYRESRLPGTYIRHALYFLAATAALIAALLGLRRFHRRLEARLHLSASETSDASRRRRLLARIWQQGTLLRGVFVLARVLVTVILVGAYLQLAFYLVPLTRGFATTVLNYFVEPLHVIWSGVLENIGDFFFILVAVVLAHYVLKGLRWLFMEAAVGRVTLPGVAPEWAMASFKIARLLAIGLMGVMIYPYIPGSDTAAFKSVGLLGGALFTLGASGAATNFIGGLTLILMKTVHKGDRVRIGDVEGDVIEVTVAIVRIRTPKNEIVTIPSGSALTSHIVNYSSLAKRVGVILHTSVTIGYDVPWRRVHELLIEAARATGEIAPKPEPFVLQKGLGDFYVEYEINAYTQSPNAMTDIYGELHQNIQDAFHRAGVEIMSPHYTSLRDGNERSIPTDQHPDRPAPRGFGVRIARDAAESEP